ncbi:LuxR C-terminal-related transcriptional regulator [Nocardia asiatica]|uniref:LuxR C-terminal-related transcriptional regulator n=3 Tax=Nocardia asiatica TaxID=209252 RepID=UPI0024560438|nr:LuxR C-terminal-related transcriptional regulator [Nocardia asiatica]
MTTSHVPALRRIPAAAESVAEIPALPFPPIPRPGLCAAADAVTGNRDGHVLLVCAPAGTGKSVLIADWAARRAAGGSDVAWVTVTPELDDAAALWTVLHARFGVPAGESARPPTAQDTLIATLAARATPTVVVLDDAHLLTDPLALAGVEYFLQHAPPSVTTVLCARFAPPIRWHVLDLHSRLTRWGMSELALSPEQVDALCRAHGCDLTGAELDTLCALTRGWAALVRIAAAHLSARADDRAAALTVLARPARAVADFLIGELVAELPPALRQFLTCTSVPAWFTEQLADELVGGGAGHQLYELDRVNFPLESVVRGGEVWFACHPLVRAHFLAEARRLGPQLCADLHRRSAHWLRRAGLPAAALGHQLAVADREDLCEFLSACALRIVLDGEGAMLFDQVARSAPALLDDPFLWLVRVVDALVAGSTAAAVACLDTATARRVAKGSFASAERLDALTLAATIDVAATTGALLPRFPDRVAPTGDPDLDAYAAIQVATAFVANGAVAHGEQLLHSGLAVAEHAGRPRLVLRALTRLAFAADAVDAATAMRDRAARALAIADEHGLSEVPDAVQATAMVAYGAYLQGETPDAAQVCALLTERVDHDGSYGPVAGWRGHVVGRLLHLEQAEEQSTAVDALRRSLLVLLERKAVPAGTGSLILPVVWALLRVHDARTAQLLVERARGIVGELPEVRLADAALHAAADRRKASCAALEPLLDRAGELRPVSAITGWLLYSAAQHEARAPAKALAALENALGCAAPHRLLRPFLDVPAAMGLLDSYAGRFGRSESFAESIRRHPAAHRRPAYPALTHTEMTVLKQLPSGRTAQQIAEDLGVSVNTVKTHLRGIYGKLGTNSRVDALDHARRGGLL